MKVYLLIEIRYHIEEIIGVFSSREKAKEAFNFYNDQFDADLDEKYTDVLECDLDQINEFAIKWPAKNMIPNYFPVKEMYKYFEKNPFEGRNLYYENNN